jgi:protein-disulfide isomerase
MRDKISFILNIIQTLALILIVILLLRVDNRPQPMQRKTQLEAQVKNTEPIVLNQNDAIWGSNDAAYTLVAYVDYECPFCKDLYHNLKEIEDEYIKTGKVKVVLRDLPLNMHPNSKRLAAIAECARQKGKFWEMADLMLTNRDKFSDSLVYAWAKQTGLDATELSVCVKDDKTYKVITEDLNDAKSRRLTGTPSVFINNEFYRGAIPAATLKAIFEGKKPERRKRSGACNQ